MASVNLFANAKVIPAKQTKGKKVEKDFVDLPGLAEYAAIVALEKALAGLKETYRAAVKTHMIDQFVIEGTRAKKRPDNFDAKDGEATANCQLKKRSSASGLNDEEIALCKQFGIKTTVETSSPETYVINPAYKDDQEILQKVSTALSKVKGLPTDFIQFQEASKKVVVDEESLDQVFTLPEKAVRQLIEVVGNVAIKPKTKASLRECLEQVMDVIVEEDEE